MAKQALRVMMVTEGTYPYHWGGVSTWCHLLLNDLPDVDFSLVSIVGDPSAQLRFDLPTNVKQFISIPIWRVREALESQRTLSLAEIIRRKLKTNEASLKREFMPYFAPFVSAILGDDADPKHIARCIHRMHRYFLKHDFDAALRSRLAWDCFQQLVIDHFGDTAARHGYTAAPFSVKDVVTGMQWLYHWLFPLAQPLPKADVVHAAMVGECTLVSIAAQLEHGAAYMLTEHGIYLRESYLAEATSIGTLFLKLLKLRFASLMTRLSYQQADLIAPCCDYNKRWELRHGAAPERLKTIYYGVDTNVFSPTDKPAGSPPTVVWVGRINPLKDLDTLLRAAALVREQRPDVRFKLFGSAAAEDRDYERLIRALHTELNLADVVEFCGFTSKPQTAFNQGDVVVLSSISEAFPFSLLEAMLCARPVVATAVGGIPEEIEGGGIVVEPRDPRAMADAILTIMNDDELRLRLGRTARARSLKEFSIRQSSSAHLLAYQSIAGHRKRRKATKAQPAGDADIATQPSLLPRRADSPPALQGLERRMAALAHEVADRVPLPIDAYEITAVLESIGVTDRVAADRYAQTDAFGLGETVFSYLRNSAEVTYPPDMDKHGLVAHPVRAYTVTG